MNTSTSPLFVVAALYKFVRLNDLESLRDELLELCQQQGLTGTLLLAEEGINGTVAGPQTAVEALLTHLRNKPDFADLEEKRSRSDKQPFARMKVKIKHEIVTMGVSNLDPNRLVGTYVEPEQWNDMIQDPAVLLIDTRNKYEYHLGSFKGAVDPQTDSFRDFPHYVAEHLDPEKHKKVAMFCTGGIRCEKSTAYLKEQGFEDVFHLRGGILNYLEKVPAEDSLWHGECFVFDDRVTVDHDLAPSAREICPNCRMPIEEGDKERPEFERNVSCKHCYDRLTDERRQSLAERHRQQALQEQRQTSANKRRVE